MVALEFGMNLLPFIVISAESAPLSTFFVESVMLGTGFITLIKNAADPPGWPFVTRPSSVFPIANISAGSSKWIESAVTAALTLVPSIETTVREMNPAPEISNAVRGAPTSTAGGLTESTLGWLVFS